MQELSTSLVFNQGTLEAAALLPRLDLSVPPTFEALAGLGAQSGLGLQQTETIVPREIGHFEDIGTSKSQEETTFARYSPDGQELLTGSCDKTLKVVDISMLRWN